MSDRQKLGRVHASEKCHAQRHMEPWVFATYTAMFDMARFGQQKRIEQGQHPGDLIFQGSITSLADGSSHSLGRHATALRWLVEHNWIVPLPDRGRWRLLLWTSSKYRVLTHEEYATQFEDCPTYVYDVKRGAARFSGHRGGVITMHRAMSRLVLEPLDLITSALLVCLFLFVWLTSLPQVCRFWQYLLRFGLKVLRVDVELGLREHHFTPYLRFVIPYLRMEGIFPDAQTWWLTIAIVCMLLGVSFLLPARLIPLSYLLRAVAFIQGTGLLVFLWEPARFPHTPDSYMEGLTGYGVALISFVPILFGFTYYIMNFSLSKKVILTAMTMVHLSLFLPLHILLEAIILQKSILFMPLLYIVFGLPVEVLMIIAFYSWGMSWPTKAPLAA